MAASNVSGPGPFAEFLGRVAYEAQLMRPLLPTYIHLLVSAIFPIYIAAHASLTRPPSAAPRARKKGVKPDEDDGDESNQKIESLTPSDALLFPLLAGATLATLYVILKWLQDPAWLNWALGLYFSQIGLFFAMKLLKDMSTVLRSMLLPAEYSASGQMWKVDVDACCFKSSGGDKATSPLPGFLRHLPVPAAINETIWKLRRFVYAKAQLHFHLHKILTIKTTVTILDLGALLFSCAIVAYHTFIAKPWFLTNFLGFSFCYGTLQFMTPTTAWTGTLILSALFCYDIYFVFFTPMMVTVATKLDVPIKLLFPRPDGCVFPVGAAEGSAAMEAYLQCLAKKRTMAMLGLGDIVVPGMMLAFALRFDLFLFYLNGGGNFDTSKAPSSGKKPTYLPVTGSWGERFWTKSRFQSDVLKAKQFPKPYFYATIFGYLAGMVTTVVVMQVTGHAQPALLYLVPGVLIFLWGTALVRGDLKKLWNYTEADEEEEDGKEKKKDKNKSEDDKEKAVAEENGTAEHDESKVRDRDEGRNEEIEISRRPPHKPNAQEKQKLKERDAEKSCRHLISFTITLSKPSSAVTNTKPKITITTETGHPSSPSTSTSDESDTASNLRTSSPNGRRQYALRSSSSSTAAADANASPPRSPIPDVKADHAVFAKLEREARKATGEARDKGDEEPLVKRRRRV